MSWLLKEGQLYFITLLHSTSKLQLIIKAFLCLWSISYQFGNERSIILTKFLIFFANDKS